MNYSEAEQFLFQRARFGMVLGLERVTAALRALGDPHRAYRSIHVAGTNGKGSTCALIESALRAAGVRTGLYTSPHLVRFAERFQVGGVEIDEAGLVRLVDRIRSACPDASTPDGLTFFEIATLMAFLHFAQSGVEVAVLETGLGGRLDATNVCSPDAAAITPISLDHTEHLGSTLAAIAGEKAGILKPGVPAVSALQAPEAAEVIGRASPGIRVEGRDFSFGTQGFVGREWRIEPLGLALRGRHQRSNAAVAAATLEAFAERTGRVAPEHVQRGFASARWPGRLETVRRGPEVILDGAHNRAGSEAVARALLEEWGRPAVVVFGAMRDKDADAMLRELATVASGWHLCAVEHPRALPPAEMRALPALARARASTHPNVQAALDAATAEAGPDGLVLVTGSLYVVGEARRILLGAPAGMRVGEVSLQPPRG